MIGHRAFGHFEKPLFIELCKHVETKFVPAGAILFRPGQVDDSIYVVRNGKLKVYIIEQVGREKERGGRDGQTDGQMKGWRDGGMEGWREG